jgi:anti-sigma factor RsiW
MDRTAATHSNHDELLIVRLFGGDVDDRERARALDLLGECEDCAALFADLGATADATAALPVPARPRDFTLTEVDAARLHRERRGIGFFSALRRTRALGGSLVAIGLVGIVATASLGLLGGTAGTFSAHSDTNRLAAEVAPTAAPAASAAPAAMGAADLASGSPLPVFAPLGASPAASPTGGVQDAAGTTGPGSKAVPPAPSGQFASDGAGSPDGLTIAAQTTSTELDARLIWLGGFGLLLLVGLIVLVGPLVRRRRTR